LIERCRHFGSCGGCTFQDVPEADYRAQKRDAVVRALMKYGIDAPVTETVAVPPGTRRRATLKIGRTPGGVEVGFHPQRSHAIVDMRECLVLTPGLLAFVQNLRVAAAGLFANGQPAEVHVTEADNGIDAGFRAEGRLNTALTGALAKAAPMLKAVRITWNGALAYESAAPVVHFGKAAVKLPIDSFLQPTREGEETLRTRAVAGVKGAKAIADLFSGIGTFSLALAEQGRVHAVVREQVMLDALAAAAKATQGLKPVTTARRDLFNVPLTALELNKFDAVVLDPPRAGAEAQARQLARSKVSRLAYVSCDAGSFARDTKILLDGGYRIGPVTPVDQFLWSSHIELVAAFARP
jgi:23S rRNA (uracil1939-C5)-methyltransferase